MTAFVASSKHGEGSTAESEAGINLFHMHMGELLHKVADHPGAEIIGVCGEILDAMRAPEN